MTVKPLVVSPQDASIMLGIDEQTIIRMIDRKEIPPSKAKQIGRQWRINLKYILSLAGEDEEAVTAESK